MARTKDRPAVALEDVYEKALSRLESAQVDLIARACAVKAMLLAKAKPGKPLHALALAIQAFEDAEEACDRCKPDHAGRTPL